MVLRSTFLTVLLFAAVGALAGDRQIALAPGDTVAVTDGALRGLVRLEDGRRIALVARADSLVAEAPERVTLEWYEGEDVVRVEDQTGVLTHGLAYDGKFLWSLGRAPGAVDAYLYKLEGDTLYVDGRYPTPGHAPLDLAWDGTHVWMVDRDRGRLDRFTPDTEQVTRSVPTPGFSPVGLCYDGAALWSADKATGRLYRLAAGTGRLLGTASSAGYDRRGEEPLLTWLDGRIWVIPTAGGVIQELRPGEKSE